MEKFRWFTTLISFLVIASAMILLGSGCTQLGGKTAAQFTPGEAQAPADTGDNAAVPGYFAGVVPWDQGEGVVPVAAAAASELYPGDGKFTQAVSAIPFVAPQPDGARSASNAAECDAYYYAENVSPSEVQGMTFDPSAGPAFACYELVLPGSGPTTVGIAWHSLPTNMNSYFVGIGDLTANAWHWYLGPDDGVLTFDPSDWNGASGGSVLVCIALEDGKLADFWQLKAGVEEMRGTGLAFEEPPAERVVSAASMEVGAASIPSTLDLTTYLHGIRNQGSMGSCTAFACTDASLGIILNQTYGGDGWDTSLDALKPSPMWAYVKSGVDPIGNWNPVCGSNVGRYMSEAFNVLEDIGAAMESTVPYYATNDCSTTFPSQAYTEASLVKTSDWYSISGASLDQTVKAQLATGHPVVIAMYKLEYTFLYYDGGVYEFNPGGSYVNGGHAMCIVGYDDSMGDAGAFKVRNSWGTGWGLSGYWWCSYESVNAMASAGRLYTYVQELTYNPSAATHFLGAGPITIDEIEPNDYPSEANALPAYPVEGFTGELSTKDGADCFSFSHRDGYSTDFSVTLTGSLELRLELYDTNGNLIYRPGEGESPTSISGAWSSTGTAVLKAQWLSGEGYYMLDASERQPPETPLGFLASDGADTSAVILSWQASSGAESYVIERAASADGPFEEVGSTFGVQFSDTTAQQWQYYYYRVAAEGAGGMSGYTAVDQGYRLAPMPQHVTASDGPYEDKVAITWTPVYESDITYIVRRSMSLRGSYTVLGETEGAFFHDFEPDKDVPYFYTVSAVKNEFEGPQSVPDSGYRHGFDPNLPDTGNQRVIPGGGDDGASTTNDDDLGNATVTGDGTQHPVKPTN